MNIIRALLRDFRRWQNRRARERRAVYTWHDPREFSKHRYYVNCGTLR